MAKKLKIIKSVTLACDLVWNKSKKKFGDYKTLNFEVNQFYCKHCKKVGVQHNGTELYVNYCPVCGDDEIAKSEVVHKK